MLYAQSISDSLTSLFGNIINVAIKVVIFLAIMLVGWIIARWLRRLVAGFLHRVGFDRAVERGGLNRVLGTHTASDLTARLLAFIFLLFVFQLAFGVFGPNPVSALIAAGVAWLPQLFVAVVIVVVAAAIAGWVRDLIQGALGATTYGRTLAIAAQALVLLLGLVAALNQIGVASSVTTAVLVAVLATMAGVLIVGVGGGLIKPMQHRWERMLNRAETETTLAAQRMRSERAATRGRDDRNVKPAAGFGQPSYPGTGDRSDTQAEHPEEHPSES